MFTTASFIRAKTWKQAKGPSVDDWTQKMWCAVCVAHAMEHDSAIKKKKILPLSTTLTDLDGITLSEERRKKNTI